MTKFVHTELRTILGSKAIFLDAAEVRGTVDTVAVSRDKTFVGYNDNDNGLQWQSNHTDLTNFMALIWLILNCCDQNLSSNFSPLCVDYPLLMKMLNKHKQTWS